MPEFKITIEYKEKKYNFSNGTEAFIFCAAIYNNFIEKFSEKDLQKYISITYDCYLRDDNPTPIGNLCDYIAEKWKTINRKKLSRVDILCNFYDSIY